jgi:hypothetical protein
MTCILSKSDLSPQESWLDAEGLTLPDLLIRPKHDG